MTEINYKKDGPIPYLHRNYLLETGSRFTNSNNKQLDFLPENKRESFAYEEYTLSSILWYVERSSDAEKWRSQNTVSVLVNLLRITDIVDAPRLSCISKTLKEETPGSLAKFLLEIWIEKHQDFANVENLCGYLSGAGLNQLAESLQANFSKSGRIRKNWSYLEHLRTGDLNARPNQFNVCSQESDPIPNRQRQTSCCSSPSVSNYSAEDYEYSRLLQPLKHVPRIRTKYSKKVKTLGIVTTLLLNVAVLGSVTFNCFQVSNLLTDLEMTTSTFPVIPEKQIALKSTIPDCPAETTLFPSASNIYIFGNGSEWSSLSLDMTDVKTIFWKGSICSKILFRLLIDTTITLEYISLEDNGVISTESTAMFKGLQVQESSTPIALLNLRVLKIMNCAIKKGILERFLGKVVLQNLQYLVVHEPFVQDEGVKIIRDILVTNRHSLKSIELSGNIWDSWLFSTEYPEFPALSEIIFDFRFNDTISKLKFPDNFCNSFPNLGVLDLPNVVVPIADLQKLTSCYKIHSLSLGIAIPRGTRSINLSILRDAPVNLNEFRVRFHFEGDLRGKSCQINGLNEVNKTLHFQVWVDSNC